MPARPHRTVERIVQILELVSVHKSGMSLAELATSIEAPKSSIQGFVYGLLDVGYLEEHDHRYFLGPAAHVLTLNDERLPKRVGPPHEELVSLQGRFDCAVLVGILVGRNVVYVDHVGTNPLEAYYRRRQPRRPTLQTAAGQVLLAHMDDEDLYDFLAREQDQERVSAFLQDVPAIRKRGAAVIAESIAPNSSAVATPILNSGGRVTAALTVAGAPDDMLGHVDEIIDVMSRASDTWSA